MRETIITCDVPGCDRRANDDDTMIFRISGKAERIVDLCPHHRQTAVNIITQLDLSDLLKFLQEK